MSPLTIALLCTGLLLLVIILWVIVSHNGFVRLRNLVQEAWRQIDVELNRRHDLIPNLLETVRGYMSYEQSTLQAVVEARRLAEAPAANLAQRARNEDALSGALSRLIALSENYPTLRADSSFLHSCPHRKKSFSPHRRRPPVLQLECARSEHEMREVPLLDHRFDLPLPARRILRGPRRSRPRRPPGELRRAGAVRAAPAGPGSSVRWADPWPGRPAGRRVRGSSGRPVRSGAAEPAGSRPATRPGPVRPARPVSAGSRPVTADDPGEGGSPRRAVPSEKGGPRSGPPGDPSLGTARMGVGVGPAPQPWPDDPRLDPELLREGDRRNVVDRYRYWSVEAIRDDLAPTRSALHVAIENLEHDLNIGSIVRTANAFNVGGVHIVGRRRWNRRGALVTDRYIDVHHRPGVSDLAEWARGHGYTMVAVDNPPDSAPLESTRLPERCVLVFGQESAGISAGLLAACQRAVRIEQYGSTRSMNVAAAAAIAMHWWIVQHRRPPVR